MSKIYLDAKSIKITILDSDSESTLDSDCNLEIVVRKSLLQNLFSDFAAISEENIEFIDCHLTSREKQVLKHISLGKNNLEIVMYIMIRSKPRPKPACFVPPYLRRFIYHQ